MRFRRLAPWARRSPSALPSERWFRPSGASWHLAIAGPMGFPRPKEGHRSCSSRPHDPNALHLPKSRPRRRHGPRCLQDLGECAEGRAQRRGARVASGERHPRTHAHARARKDGGARLHRRPRGLSHRHAEGRGGEHPHREDRGGEGHHVLRQLLGLQQGAERRTHGEGPGGRRTREGVPHDQARRAHQGRGRSPARAVDEAPAHQRHRSCADSRDHPARRSRSVLRCRRLHRGAGGGEETRPHPLHRIHRSQEPRHSPGDAGGRRGARLRVRHRADAPERDGRTLPQLREERAPGGGEEGPGRIGNEVHRQRHLAREQEGDRAGVLELRALATDLGGHRCSSKRWTWR